MIQDKFIEQESKKANFNNKDKMTNQFVRACRLYNKGLSCQKYMLKLIKEYIPNYSLSTFVKKIPDKALQGKEHPLGLSVKSAIFLQKAALCTFNRVANKHFIQNCFKLYPETEEKL